MTTSPVDGRLALEAASSQELAQRKLMVDNLKTRLGDGTTKEQKLREACEGFEAIFVQKMWEQMRKTVNKEGYLHSKDEEFYQSMFDQELAKKMTQAGGLGLADMLEEQLTRRLSDASRSTIGSTGRPVTVPSTPSTAVSTAKPGAEDLYEPVAQAGEIVNQEAATPAAPTPEQVLAQALQEIREERDESRRQAEQIPEPRMMAPIAEAGMTMGSAAQEPSASVPPVMPGRVSAPGKGRPSTQARRSSSRQRAATRNSGGRNEAVQGAMAQPQAVQSQAAQPVTGVAVPQNSPVRGELISAYGRQDGGAWNTGMTVLAEAGAAVSAPAPGTVVFAGQDERQGPVVVIDHDNGMRGIYSGAVAENTRPGERIEAGRVFAKLAAGPEDLSPGEANFRLEVRRGELAVNPEFLLGRA